MEIRVLGPVQLIADDGSELAVPGTKERTLLAVLALHARRVVPIEVIADSLWGGEAERASDRAVRTYVSRLRKHLPPAAGLEHRPGGYVLLVPDATVDLEMAEQDRVLASTELAAGRPDRAVTAAVRGLARWRGPVLPELQHIDRHQALAQGLEELRQGLAELRLRALLASGRAPETIGDLAELCETYPYREGLWRLRMQALYATGRQAEALACFEQLRRRLAEDLGVDPDPDTRAAHGALLAQDSPLGSPERAKLPAHDGADRLPRAGTSFVGRAAALTELVATVTAEQLVTLVGPGGAGKTRLAAETARTLVGCEPRGPWWVSLADLRETSEVVPAIAAAVGVGAGGTGGSSLDSVVLELTDASCLLVLDNCEHVRAAVAAIIDELQRRCAGLRVLATSREPVRLPGEVVLRIPALEVPPAEGGDAPTGEYPAVQLFADRAAAVVPAFTLDEATRAVVGRIVRELDGSPLAIELAAPLLRVLTPGALLDRLDDRFRVLRSRDGERPDRHRSLVSLLEWSYELLPAAEQRLWEELSVFVGGFTIAAAEAVARDTDDVLEGVQHLLDASVVSGLDGRADSRLSMNVTVRAYGARRLEQRGDAEGARQRHLDWMHALLQPAAQGLVGADPQAWCARLAPEVHNLHAAIQWGIGAAPPDALELARSAWRFWELTGRWEEGLDLLDRALSAADERDPSAIEFLHGAGMLALRSERFELGVGYFQRCGALARELGDRRGDAVAQWGELHILGVITTRRSGDDLDAFQPAIDVFRELGDEVALARALYSASQWRWDVGDDDAERTLLEEALKVAEGSGNLVMTAFALQNLGNNCQRRGDVDGALSFWRRACAAHRRAGHPYGLVSVALDLLESEMDHGHTLDLELLDEVCTHAWTVRHNSHLRRAWTNLASVGRLRGVEYVAAKALEVARRLEQAVSDDAGLAAVVAEERALALQLRQQTATEP